MPQGARAVGVRGTQRSHHSGCAAALGGDRFPGHGAATPAGVEERGGSGTGVFHFGMVSWSVLGLLTTVLLAVAAAGLYGAVAWSVLAAPRRGHPAVAWFAAGWLGIAGMLFIDGAKSAIGFVPDAGLYIALVWMKILANGLMLAGFIAYILYIATGRRWSLWVGPAVGLAHALFWLASTNAGLPGELVVGTWATRMEFQGPGLANAGGLGFVMFFAPSIGCALAYLAVGRGVSTTGQKMRHRMVSVSLLVLLVAATVQGDPTGSPDSVLFPLGMLVSLAAGSITWMAFRPPAWLQARGVTPFGS